MKPHNSLTRAPRILTGLFALVTASGLFAQAPARPDLVLAE